MSATHLPANCVSAPDGNLTISPASGVVFTVYCHNGLEYLSLVNTGGPYNISRMRVNNDLVTSQFSRVRLDPVTLRVDQLDYTFAVSTGRLTTPGWEPYVAHPYASAIDCWNSGPTTSNVDLTGTPFRLAQAFSVEGAATTYDTSHASISADQKVAVLSVDGGCGVIAPLGSSHWGVIARPLGYTLQLAYVPLLNAAPLADAGVDQAVNEGDTVSLDASGSSDANVDALTFAWEQTGGPAVTLASPDTAATGFTALDNGTYTFGVRVRDVFDTVDEDSTVVTVQNVAPVVTAGLDAATDETGVFNQPGAFTDPGADLWTAAVDYADGSGVQPLVLNPGKSFELSHTYLSNGDYDVQVCVSDDDLGEGCDTVTVTVVRDTEPPAVTVTFPDPDGQNSWFVASPVIASVAVDDTGTGGSSIDGLSCTGATLGAVTGIGTPNASALLSIVVEGISTVTCTATDSAGHSGAGPGSSNAATVQLDSVAPAVAANPAADVCAVLGAGGWCRGVQTAGFTAADATSGLASPSPCAGTDCDFTQATSQEGASVMIASGPVCDKAGNCHLGVEAGPYQLDSQPPVIDIAAPAAGSVYLLGAPVAASYSCQDQAGLSGVSGCSGPVPDGASLDTSSVGPHAFSVTATDIAGNTSQLTHGYDVHYAFSGFFQPVDNLPTVNAVSAGRAIPVKFSLGGNQGLSILAAGYPKSQPVACSATAPETGIEETVSAGASSLTYDTVSQQYTYVWKTDPSWAGTCRQLVVKLADGTSHWATFKFK